ncbi:MAG: CPXCG motif-containing cysteine-rich protein [Candidatus Omnitrophota bacterium]|nr:CPXCG motif-containing cysteine-rich protein [Candidatus Omnitrophota bacterium]MDZ4242034.1 CPXCG motif-containing cysteine-rich protein [Candidatus Omnitrophota bacterium]
MGLTFEKEFLCPCCGGGNSICLEGGQGRTCQLVIDCEVCCRPLRIEVRATGRDCEIEVHGENE